MKRSHLLLFLVVLTAITFSYEFYQAALVEKEKQKPGPVLAFEKFDYDLGECDPGDKLSGTLKLKNNSAEKLTFHANASCGCTDLAPTTGTIASYGEQEISVALNLPFTTGSRKTASIVASWKADTHVEPRRSGTASCRIVGRTGYTFVATPRTVKIERSLDMSLAEDKPSAATGQRVNKVSNTGEQMDPIERSNIRERSQIDKSAQAVESLPTPENRSEVIRRTVKVSGMGRAQFAQLDELNISGTANITIEKVEKCGDSCCRISFAVKPFAASPHHLETIQVVHRKTKDSCIIPVEINTETVAQVVPPVLRISKTEEQKSIERTVMLYSKKGLCSFEVENESLPNGVVVTKVEEPCAHPGSSTRFLISVATTDLPAGNFQINYRCLSGQSTTLLAQQVRVK